MSKEIEAADVTRWRLQACLDQRAEAKVWRQVFAARIQRGVIGSEFLFPPACHVRIGGETAGGGSLAHVIRLRYQAAGLGAVRSDGLAQSANQARDTDLTLKRKEFDRRACREESAGQA